MKKLLVFVLVLLAQQTRLYSQEIYKRIAERISTVDYIFEGVVLKTYPYKTGDDKTIYTSNVIQVTKIFKGNISCGTIELITNGGAIGKEECHGSHSLELQEGQQGIFLCSATQKELPATAVYAFSIPDKVDAYYEWQSFIKYAYENGDWKAYDLWQKFEHLTDLYGLTEWATQFTYIDCSAEGAVLQPPHIAPPITQPYAPQAMPHYSRADADLVKVRQDYSREHYSRPKTSRSVETLNYTLSNLIITGTNPKYLEYDVDLSDATANHYFSQGEVRIVYNPAVFGQYVVTNNKIAVTNGSLANSSCYFTVTPQDDNPSTISMGIGAHDYSICKSQLSSSPQQLLHVKMEIQTCNLTSKISIADTSTFFSSSLMTGGSGYSQSSGDTFFVYYDAVTTDSLPVPGCSMKITSFSPDSVNGGEGDILTIRGYQFGSTAGNVYFKNSGDGGNGPELMLEHTDLVSWSDTTIKVIVASRDSAINSNRPFGSGSFIVESASLERDTSIPLTIFYSLYNYRDSATTVKFPMYLNNQNGQGGIEFYVDTVLSHDSLAYFCFQTALTNWSCATGVNLTIKGDTFGLPHVPANDGINYVTYGNPGAGAGASTYKLAVPCTSGSNVHILNSVDIILSDALRTSNGFFYNAPIGMFGTAQTLPANKVDFYYAVLHELGHGIGVNHNNNPASIMYYYHPTLNTPVSGSARNVNLKNDKSCVFGGQYEVAISANQTNYGTCATAMTPVPLCLLTNEVIEIDGKSDLQIAPNPFGNRLTVYLKEQKDDLVSVKMISVDGKEMLNTTLQSSNGNSFAIEVPELQNGLYLLIVKVGDTMYTKKLIHAAY
ncbi:MAG: hypothetical protein JWO03_1734 [Bacteroidetes bacterium]|nr:hypothetical protein [Bacteroidota bacterium]